MKFHEPEQFVDSLNRIFAGLNIRIAQVLPDSEIDHIGSSSITGAISKGDLDILVRVEQDRLNDAIEVIQGLGFEIKQGTLRTESLCMLVTTEFDEDVAIQLIARRSQFEDFLRFRNRLNASPELVRQYNQLKRESVGLEAQDYRAKKSAFIERVLAD